MSSRSVIEKIEQKYKKKAVVDMRSGDYVRVHQKIREGGKERIQIFEGLVIRTNRKNSLSASFTVRRIASGVGVEKTFLIHSPSVLKVEVTKRSKVRRNYLSYMRGLKGKGARLAGTEFDKDSVNIVEDEAAEAEAEKLKEAAELAHEEKDKKAADKQAKQEAKAEAAIAKRDQPEPQTEATDELPPKS